MYVIPLSIPTEKKEYQITYQTPFDDVKIPDGKNSATVENTFTEDDRYSAKDQERISHGHFGVAKWSENNNVLVQDGSTTLLQWVVRISFPDNNDDLIMLTYRSEERRVGKECRL